MKRDERYLKLITEPIEVCSHYRPKMGRGRGEGYDIKAFQELYGADSFYSWIGLSSPLMYAAHRTNGAMTSIYRQIGVGCENLFRQVLIDELGLGPDEVKWSYQSRTAGGKTRTLHLDGRISLDAIDDQGRREVVKDWIGRAGADVGVAEPVSESLSGVIFEVRQGYKSRDSKRQNADIANAATAYVNSYLPCISVFSSQIDSGIHARYRSERWATLIGDAQSDDDIRSIYAFMNQVIGYDLAAFLERNSGKLRSSVSCVLRSLLEVENQ